MLNSRQSEISARLNQHCEELLSILREGEEIILEANLLNGH
ncbi:MAG: hypothetical protein QNJ63_23090 [Calothrix sp. MO_192.B10]|nr:hypothetical protein [Calothrix sp. MO_192.B10]